MKKHLTLCLLAACLLSSCHKTKDPYKVTIENILPANNGPWVLAMLTDKDGSAPFVRWFEKYDKEPMHETLSFTGFRQDFPMETVHWPYNSNWQILMDAALVPEGAGVSLPILQEQTIVGTDIDFENLNPYKISQYNIIANDLVGHKGFNTLVDGKDTHLPSFDFEPQSCKFDQNTGRYHITSSATSNTAMLEIALQEDLTGAQWLIRGDPADLVDYSLPRPPYDLADKYQLVIPRKEINVNAYTFGLYTNYDDLMREANMGDGYWLSKAGMRYVNKEF